MLKWGTAWCGSMIDQIQRTRRHRQPVMAQPIGLGFWIGAVAAAHRDGGGGGGEAGTHARPGIQCGRWPTNGMCSRTGRGSEWHTCRTGCCPAGAHPCGWPALPRRSRWRIQQSRAVFAATAGPSRMTNGQIMSAPPWCHEPLSKSSSRNSNSSSSSRNNSNNCRPISNLSNMAHWVVGTCLGCGPTGFLAACVQKYPQTYLLPEMSFEYPRYATLDHLASCRIAGLPDFLPRPCADPAAGDQSRLGEQVSGRRRNHRRKCRS